MRIQVSPNKKLFLSGIGVVLSLAGIDFFGSSVFLAFCFIAVPLTVSALRDSLRKRGMDVSVGLLPILVAAFSCSFSSFFFFFFSHFGLGTQTPNVLFSVTLFGTILSFACLVYFTHFHLVRILTKGKIISLSPYWSAYSMWLGYFFLLNYPEISNLLFDNMTYPYTLSMLKLFVIFSGFVFVTPFIFFQSFNQQLENTASKQVDSRSEWLKFWLFVLASYSLYYWMNGATTWW